MQLVRHHQDISLPASACALGMFDGVHLGHQMVLENAVREARIRQVPSVVFSFADHPQKLLAETPTQLLSTLDERLARFKQLGFDYALILDFSPWLKELSPTEFVTEILVNTLHVLHVTVGYDHRFGKNRTGSGELLTELGSQYGFEVDVIEPVKVTPLTTSLTLTHADPLPVAGQIVSSTLIRKLLSYGDVQQANQLLGRPYTLIGAVEEGLKRGRELGFPTANLTVEPGRVIPAIGTYGGFATLNGKTYPAVCNIGHSPTFDDSPAKSRIEVHLLDYNGPAFYGEQLSMEFLERLRDEMKFPTVDALIAQIHADCLTLRNSLQTQT